MVFNDVREQQPKAIMDPTAHGLWMTDEWEPYVLRKMAKGKQDPWSQFVSVTTNQNDAVEA